MLHYQIIVIPKWELFGFDLYIIDSQNKLRNRQTGKIVQMQLKGYTRGYYLNGKFKSLSALRPLLMKYEEAALPF